MNRHGARGAGRNKDFQGRDTARWKNAGNPIPASCHVTDGLSDRAGMPWNRDAGSFTGYRSTREGCRMPVSIIAQLMQNGIFLNSFPVKLTCPFHPLPDIYHRFA